MNKILILLAVMALGGGGALAQKKAPAQKRAQYEFMRNLPVYADSLIKDWTFPLAWENAGIKDFSEWRKVARQKILDCMLTPPPPAALDKDGHYEVRVIREEKREGYTARQIEVRLSRYYWVPALVLVPDGKGPFPAVNCLHDHGAHLYIGKEKMVKPIAPKVIGNDSTEYKEYVDVMADAQKWVDELYSGRFVGDELAKQGYVVFSADAPLWGERGQKEGANRDKYDMIAGNMMMYGIDLSAYMTYDDIAGTEFMAQMPEVDKDRIGCMGFSMGAYRSWMLAALSDRIKAAACVCWMVSGDEQMSFKYKRTENGGFANCIPGLRRWLDYPHIASIACPNAMLFINGSLDKLFPVPGVEKAYEEMHNVWNSQGVGDKLQTEILDVPHSFYTESQEKVFKFLKGNLH